MSVPPSAVSDYRLSPVVMARFIGSYLVAFAVLMLIATIVVASIGWNPDLLVVLLVVGLLGLFGLGWYLRSRLVVVRLTSSGYRVNLVRGAGVREARWSDVEDAVAAYPRDLHCVVLRLRTGGTTTIPMQVLAADKDDFARDVHDRLDAAKR